MSGFAKELISGISQITTANLHITPYHIDCNLLGKNPIVVEGGWLRNFLLPLMREKVGTVLFSLGKRTLNSKPKSVNIQDKIKKVQISHEKTLEFTW